jgi:hypothetical protein
MYALQLRYLGGYTVDGCKSGGKYCSGSRSAGTRRWERQFWFDPYAYNTWIHCSNPTNAHGTNRLFLIMINWNIMCIEKWKKPMYIYCMLNQFKFDLCWLKLHQISLYFIITKLNRVSPISCCAKNGIAWSPYKSASKYHVIRKITNETYIRSCLTHLITKTTTAKRCLKKQSRED